jgi:hypothetical protein
VITTFSIRPSGIRSRVARRLAILSLRARIRSGTQDLDHLVAEHRSLPAQINQLDRDIAALRVQLAIEEQT